jgi:CDP-glucose 4,6-dehydratase
VSAFGGVYAGRRVLVTGHTGFKGSWLATWLGELGAEVTGLALAPTSTPNHWDLLELAAHDRRGDVRDFDSVAAAVQAARPEIVFHLAAQPLVRASYREPLETWATNVQGVVNLLEACRRASGVRAVVVITTDKVYENREWTRGYREDDALGGHDPYSASKAAAEIVVSSYRKAFLGGQGVLLASARAGNVVGGGDWSEDRLVPDLVRAAAARSALEIRSPRATRPWQHVLESLSGYLLLGERLLRGDASCADAFNFGPDAADNRCVADVLAMLEPHWPALRWELSRAPHPHEAGLLYLDNSKVRERLGWRPVWGLERCVAATAEWYRAYYDQNQVLTRAQLATFLADARAGGAEWAGT